MREAAYRIDGDSGDRAPDRLALDEPFDDLMTIAAASDPDVDERRFDRTDHGILCGYLAYLSAERIPEHYLPHFEAEALAFRGRFREVAMDRLDATMLDAYLEEARHQSLSARSLRNRRVACDALLRFLHARANPMPIASVVPAPPPIAATTTDRCSPADNRRAPRITFLASVHIDNLGVVRCSDLSVGGMYIETISCIGAQSILRVHFRLQAADPQLITARGRVAFQHRGLGAGLEFIGISHQDVARIAALVARMGGGHQS